MDPPNAQAGASRSASALRRPMRSENHVNRESESGLSQHSDNLSSKRRSGAWDFMSFKDGTSQGVSRGTTRESMGDLSTVDSFKAYTEASGEDVGNLLMPNKVVNVSKYLGHKDGHPWYYYLPLRYAVWYWLPKYKMADLQGDIVSGLSVGIMIIPQGLAHAAIAGTPLVMGLYAALAPLFTYAILGSSRHLAVGSGAVVALLINAALAELPKVMGDCGEVFSISGEEGFDALPAITVQICEDCHRACGPLGDAIFLFEGKSAGGECIDRCLQDTQYLAALVLAFLAGLIQVMMGLLKLGRVVNFLSGAVLEGFTIAAGITILVGQIRHFFGLDKDTYLKPCLDGEWLAGWSCTSPRTYATLLQTAAAMGTVSAGDAILGTASLLALWAAKKYKPAVAKKKGAGWRLLKEALAFTALFVVALATTASYYVRDSDTFKAKVVGKVPTGLPDFRVPISGRSSSALIGYLVFPAVGIGIVGFITSYAVGKQVAVKKGYTVDGSQEMVAQGMANLVGSFFGSFVTQGSLSRTAVNAQAANTQAAGIISAGVVLAGLLFLLPLVEYLPKSALAAIIIMACRELVDPVVLVTLLKKGVYREALVLAFTLCLTLVFGAQNGMAASIVLSIVLVIGLVSAPPCGEMGRLPGSINFKSIVVSDSTLIYSHLAIFEFESAIFFVNKDFFADELHHVMHRAQQTRGPLTRLIINMAGVSYIDSSGIKTIQHFISMCNKSKIKIFFCSMGQNVKNEFWRWGIPRILGGDHFYHTVQDAVEDCIAEIQVEEDAKEAGGGDSEAKMNAFQRVARNLVNKYMKMKGIVPILITGGPEGTGSFTPAAKRRRSTHTEDLLFPSVFDSWTSTAYQEKSDFRKRLEGDEAANLEDERLLEAHQKLLRPSSLARRQVYEAFSAEDKKYIKMIIGQSRVDKGFSMGPVPAPSRGESMGAAPRHHQGPSPTYAHFNKKLAAHNGQAEAAWDAAVSESVGRSGAPSSAAGPEVALTAAPSGKAMRPPESGTSDLSLESTYQGVDRRKGSVKHKRSSNSLQEYRASATRLGNSFLSRLVSPGRRGAHMHSDGSGDNSRASSHRAEEQDVVSSRSMPSVGEDIALDVDTPMELGSKERLQESWTPFLRSRSARTSNGSRTKLDTGIPASVPEEGEEIHAPLPPPAQQQPPVSHTTSGQVAGPGGAEGEGEASGHGAPAVLESHALSSSQEPRAGVGAAAIRAAMELEAVTPNDSIKKWLESVEGGPAPRSSAD